MKLQSLLEMPYYIPREYKFTTEYQTRFIKKKVLKKIILHIMQVFH